MTICRPMTRALGTRGGSRSYPTLFQTSYADINATDVPSSSTIPAASNGEMSIAGGAELSLDKITWASSITYVSGARVWARGDASDTYETPLTYAITGVDFTDEYIVLTIVEPVISLHDADWDRSADWDRATDW